MEQKRKQTEEALAEIYRNAQLALQSISDILAFIFAIPFTVIFFKEIKKSEQETQKEKETSEQVCVE